MAIGDIVILENTGSNGGRGGRLYNVAAGTPILAGEPVQRRGLGATVVEPALTSTPVVGTDFYAGVAATNSTNTLTAAGSVYVYPIDQRHTWLISPAAPASWDTQSEYDALVGKRVLIQNGASVTTSPQNIGSYTLLATDNAANGCVVQAIDISKYPGKVAFAFRGTVADVA